METYIPMIKDALGMFLFLGAELSILFILISAGVSLLQQYIPDSKVQQVLGSSNGKGYLLAAGLGAITPFCTCSTIPMLRGLLRAKAGFGPTLTFLFASPLLNPIIIGLFVATFGLKVTITYTCIALIVSILAGIILKSMGYERYVIQDIFEKEKEKKCCPTEAKDVVLEMKPVSTAHAVQASSCCTSPSAAASPFSTPQGTTDCCNTTTQSSSCCSAKPDAKPLFEPIMAKPAPVESCCGSSAQSTCCDTATTESSCCGTAPLPENATLKQKCLAALKDGYAQFKEVLPFLLLGISLGAIIYGFVPSDFIAKYASGDSFFAVPIAAVIGIPLYVRVEALIPLSAVLLGKGMGLGAVMALIIGGGGASLTEVILLKSLFKLPIIIAFLIVVLVMAMGAGYIFQFAF